MSEKSRPLPENFGYDGNLNFDLAENGWIDIDKRDEYFLAIKEWKAHLTDDLKKKDTADIINCLPQNNMMYKDGGLWEICEEDNPDLCIIRQNGSETFRALIVRYVDFLRSTLEYEQREEMETDLCVL